MSQLLRCAESIEVGIHPGVQMHVQVRDRGSRLSPREREVLQLAANGQAIRGIAEALFLSPGTIKTHFQHIYSKLGVHDRASAVATGLRLGLIE